ncbi:1-acyl-sn-glycerol-3-phosphate acyltransferase [Halopseudomonas nanhaiensis]|uniref:lysophospholipid acyltransferase family protein n=1 Tax=Halopseudomonas nanhaiensis TaxID=2830842 RepID=UPI001CBBE32A|nr:lysophospholipid acyltransferase family protein [Halopseudomonas nanhaiensis]UAW99278.1 1-acyl-sn-glycerol-3-phosphate acyltransferase [Halopseudomonas nanhaiensis]
MACNQRKVTAAAPWQRIGVFLGSLLVTVAYCVDVLWRAALGRLERSRVDRYTRSWSGWLLRLIRMRLSVEGDCPDFNDGRRYIILCNHASHYDIPATFVAMPGSIRMLAKSELYRIPLLGSAMRAAEFPSINRHRRDQALADLQRARTMMESGIVLWAAPEGTRSPDGSLLPFKKGCFHLALDTGAIVVPVAIRGIHHVLPARTRQFNLGQPVSVHIGEPIDSCRYDLAGLMTETRARMLDLLGEQAAGVAASGEPARPGINPQPF